MGRKERAASAGKKIVRNSPTLPRSLRRGDCRCRRADGRWKRATNQSVTLTHVWSCTRKHRHTPIAPRLCLSLFLFHLLSDCSYLLHLPTHMHTMIWLPVLTHACWVSKLSGQGRKNNTWHVRLFFFFFSFSSSEFFCPKFAALLNTDSNVFGHKYEHYVSEMLKTESYSWFILGYTNIYRLHDTLQVSQFS